MLEIVVDGVDGEHGVSAHVRVAMFQTRADRLHQRLEQLGLLQFAKKAQSRAANELVRMLKIATVRIANKNHLVAQFALFVN